MPEAGRSTAAGLRGPAAQVSAVIALALALAFAAATALTLVKFSEALSNAVSARYAIHAADLRATIETGINLGLDVAEITGNIEVVVQSRLALDEGIVRIAVTGADGGTVYAVERGGQVPAGTALSEHALPIENSHGAPVGRVSVVYASAVDGGAIRDAARALLPDVALLMVVSTAIATLGCLLVLAPLPRALRRAEAAFAAPDPTAAGGAGIDALAHSAAAAGAEALAALEGIEARLAAEAGRRGP